MVAYTTPDCLPFFECDDSPCLNTGTVCDPSTVWCDLTAILEQKLNGFDETIGRTATAVPFAKVALTTTQTIDTSVASYDNMIRFDTVLADNDNMVNLDSNSRFIRIRRPGLWHFELYMSGSPPATAGNMFVSYITQGNYVSMSLGQAMWRDGVVYNRAATDVEVTQTGLDATLTFNVGAAADYDDGIASTTGIVTVTYAELTAYWIGEEVP